MAKPKDTYLAGFHQTGDKPQSLKPDDIEFFVMGPKDTVEQEISNRAVMDSEYANTLVFKLVPVKVTATVTTQINGKIKTRKRSRRKSVMESD